MSTLGYFECLKLFKDNIIKFFDALIEQFPDEPDFIVTRIFFENQIPVEEALIKFSDRIVPCAEMIRNKDESFFLNSNDIFRGVKEEKVNHFRSLWRSGKLSKDDKDQMWRWFKLFVGICENF